MQIKYNNPTIRIQKPLKFSSLNSILANKFKYSRDGYMKRVSENDLRIIYTRIKRK